MQIAVIWQSGIFIYILVLKGKALLPYAAKQYSKKKKVSEAGYHSELCYEQTHSPE